MEKGGDVIVLSSESDNDGDITFCGEDVQVECDSDNSESIPFPISPASHLLKDFSLHLQVIIQIQTI